MLYFAYGQNMNLKDIGRWCEAHKIHHIRIISKRPAILHGFKLVFDHFNREYQCGIANVHPVENEFIEGVLYEIEDQDFWIIKKKNGVPGVYDEYIDPVSVELKDGTLISRVKIFYIPEERCQADLKPSKEYLQLLINGAVEEKLSLAYISSLKSIPTLKESVL